MARLALTVALLTLTTTRAYAEESPGVDPETTAVADEYGLDPTDLAGASASTGVSARAYAEWLSGPDSAPDAEKSRGGAGNDYPVGWPWTALAQCEAGGRWSTNTGNGYYGGLQEDMTFWRNYGGPAYASRPDLASPSAQVVVAKRGQAVQGWQAWPVCSRRVGLR